VIGPERGGSECAGAEGQRVPIGLDGIEIGSRPFPPQPAHHAAMTARKVNDAPRLATSENALANREPALASSHVFLVATTRHAIVGRNRIEAIHRGSSSRRPSAAGTEGWSLIRSNIKMNAQLVVKRPKPSLHPLRFQKRLVSILSGNFFFPRLGRMAPLLSL